MFTAYRPVLAVPAVRRAIGLGFLVRMPLFTLGVVLTLHIVGTLHRSYAAAGVATAVLLVAIGVGAPWRGRLLDRHGLRPVLVPAILAQVVAAVAVPWVGYAGLLVVCAGSSLFTVPGQAVIRQALMTAVPEEQRRTALSLDGMVLELSAAIGPAIAVAVAAAWQTTGMLVLVSLLFAAGGALLWWANLPITTAGAVGPHVPRRVWLRLRFLGIVAACAVAAVMLSGTELGIVAVVRSHGRPGLVGVVMAAWAVGSLVGGALYGGLHRSLDLRVLLAALALLTLLPAFSVGLWSLGAWVFVAGIACQPVITAGVEALSQAVPERARGEALGWHSAAMTSGSAAGAPLAGLAVDAAGPPWAFAAVATLGLLVAALGALSARTRWGR